MRAIRRCALLVPLLSVDPIQAGRTGTQFDVTATVVTACRSIGTPATWTRALAPGDRMRLVTVDCGADAGFRIRGPWPATGTPASIATPADGPPPGEAEDAITVTVEF
jgi:hypothetical protein